MSPKTKAGGTTGGEKPAADPVQKIVADESAAASEGAAPGEVVSGAPAAESVEQPTSTQDEEAAPIVRTDDPVAGAAEHASEQNEYDVMRRENVVVGNAMLHVVWLRSGAIVAAGAEHGGTEPMGTDRALWKEHARTQTDSLVEMLRDNE